jgi:hypothetical protein
MDTNILKTLGKYTIAATLGLLILGWFGLLLALTLTVILEFQMNKKEKN